MDSVIKYYIYKAIFEGHNNNISVIVILFVLEFEFEYREIIDIPFQEIQWNQVFLLINYFPTILYIINQTYG